jgi:hypothetical protein
MGRLPVPLRWIRKNGMVPVQLAGIGVCNMRLLFYKVVSVKRLNRFGPDFATVLWITFRILPFSLAVAYLVKVRNIRYFYSEKFHNDY